MARLIRISTIQLPAVIQGRSFSDKQKENLRLIRAALKVAGERGSDIALFGEYANLHHRSVSQNKKDYIPDRIPGPFTRSIGEYARRYKMNIIIPVLGVRKKSTGSFAVVIGRDGMIAAFYQKVHATESEKKLGILPGDTLPVITLDCCKIGCITCMDIEYPETAQIYMLKGAELLVFPHVQSSWGEPDWEVRYRARAIDTGLILASACYGYPEGEWKPGLMIGRSGIVGRDGLIRADIGRAIGVLTTDVDLDIERITMFYFDRKLPRTEAIRASRRPDVYGELVKSNNRREQP